MEVIPKDISTSIYADDIAVWYSNKDVSKSEHQIQNALINISKWVDQWELKINMNKTTYTIFTLNRTEHAINLNIKGQQLALEPTPTYLEITLDKKLTWKYQIEKSITKSNNRMKIMKKLAGSDWGANEKTLKIKSLCGLCETSVRLWNGSMVYNF